MKPRLRLTIVALSACLVWPACGQKTTIQPVSVAYAGSLVTPMEGPIRTALRSQGVDFRGEAAGSAVLSHLIAAGAKRPDVFISADAALVSSLGDRVRQPCTFAGTRLGIGWLPSSRFASTFDAVAAGKMSLLDALGKPGLAIGRTDPRLDPKGRYTLAAVRRFAGASGARRILGSDENPAQTFPEQDLLVRLETSQADVGFFYETEAAARHLRFFAIPGQPRGTAITYTLAVMRAAPHPAAAARFERFLLVGDGKTILERARVRYFDTACVRGAGRMLR